jgi:CRISPR/Cas system-associated protein Cas7 (RAMP superfamily)
MKRINGSIINVGVCKNTPIFFYKKHKKIEHKNTISATIKSPQNKRKDVGFSAPKIIPKNV